MRQTLPFVGLALSIGLFACDSNPAPLASQEKADPARYSSKNLTGTCGVSVATRFLSFRTWVSGGVHGRGSGESLSIDGAGRVVAVLIDTSSGDGSVDTLATCLDDADLRRVDSVLSDDSVRFAKPVERQDVVNRWVMFDGFVWHSEATYLDGTTSGWSSSNETCDGGPCSITIGYDAVSSLARNLTLKAR